MTSTFDTDVLVVGAGPMGATTALALAREGVRVQMVNRYNWTASTPRAHITNQRAVEVLRDLGVEPEARQFATPWEWMGDTLFTTSLAGPEVARLRTWGTGDKRIGDYLQGSPCPMLDIPQDRMEPILVKHAAAHGAVLAFNTEYVGHEQDADGVTVTLRDLSSSRERQVRARYLVGADGATHAGSYDVTYLACLPDFVVMAAADEIELMHMVATSAAIDDRPSAFRYPRGEGVGIELPAKGTPLEIGKGRIVREGTKIALLSFGTRLQECLKAADDLAARGLSTTVADARFAKPLDTDLVKRLAREHEVLITIEEGAVGGFAAQVMQYLATAGALDHGLKIRPMILPDRFIDHAAPAKQCEWSGLDAKSIAATALAALGIAREERARG